MVRPLEGLRVVDCALGGAGPQATGLLADYGAEVIWVEPPGGDPARRREPGAASAFNRGKRSIILDLNSIADRDRILKLVERCDVFVETWRPGEAAASGLGYDQLHLLNSGLIYCSISGFGRDDPRNDLPAYEPLVHALIGTMAQQAGHREPPIFQGIPFASTGAAQLAVIGILASLYRRLEDGVGRHVETSLIDGALAFHSMVWGESDASMKLQARTSGPSPTRYRSSTRLVARSFLCGDGEYIGVHTAAAGAFGRLMEVLGLADQVPASADGVDVGTPLTPEQSDLIEREIHGIFAARPRAYWVQRLMEADVCAIEHLKPTMVFDESQARHNEMVLTLNDPVLGPVDQVAPGMRFDGVPPAQPAPAPWPGRDTESVLASLAGPDDGASWRGKSLPGPADTRPLLTGVNILDFGAFYAGPYSSRILADLGADVIKVETVVGDQLRGIERPFFSAQAGKRSLAANLKHQGLKKAVDHLIQWADIIHHNMRPGAAERLGLGAAQVRTVNPNAIYLYAPGWGSGGPHMMRQSFAPMLSGYVGASYEVAGQYNEPMPSVGNEDPGNGLLGAIGMLMALLHRKRTGRAVTCENPQLNAAMGLMAHIVRQKDGDAIGAARLDVLQTGGDALESLYATADGWVCVVAREDAEIEAFGLAVGLDVLGDPRFGTVEGRRQHREELAELLRPIFESRDTAAWLATFSVSCVAAVAPAGSSFMHDFFSEPYERRCGRVAEVAHPEKGNVREIAHLVRISHAEVVPHRLAPELGQHSDEILSWAGYEDDEIAALKAAGSVNCRRPAP
jgi:crotonobetainyl-CoA:carnitine CoA-transferase CaiB-like acyl-CoA transferase